MRAPPLAVLAAALLVAGVSCSSSTGTSSTGRWVPVSSLHSPREGGGSGLGGSAVRLADGSVLFAGGYHSLSGKFEPDASFFLSTTEIFNPASRRWSKGPSMNQPRFGAAMVLLPQSGKVLAAGGGAGENAVITPSAEVFDPRAGTWTFVDEMSTCRVSASATVLQSGDVLLAGGVGCDGKAQVSTEIFHPATGGWSPAASMSQARWGHSATTLADGRILVAGGRASAPQVQPEQVLASAEIYDPARNIWIPAAPMHVGRVLQAAARLSSGSVIVAGGHIQNPDLHASTTSVELYDPRSDTWTVARPMNAPREEGGSVLLDDGTFLMAGGGQQASAEIYHPSTGMWVLTRPMRTIHDDAALVELTDGTVLIAGGFTLGTTSYHNTAIAEVFHPAGS